jgi:hypothetical protein
MILCQSLVALFYPGAVHDSKIFASVFDELKKRRILRYIDISIANKGFTVIKTMKSALHI